MGVEYDELERLYSEVTLGRDEPDIIILRSELRKVEGRKRRVRFVAVPGFGWMSYKELKKRHKENQNAVKP